MSGASTMQFQLIDPLASPATGDLDALMATAAAAGKALPAPPGDHVAAIEMLGRIAPRLPAVLELPLDSGGFGSGSDRDPEATGAALAEMAADRGSGQVASELALRAPSNIQATAMRFLPPDALDSAIDAASQILRRRGSTLVRRLLDSGQAGPTALGLLRVLACLEPRRRRALLAWAGPPESSPPPHSDSPPLPNRGPGSFEGLALGTGPPLAARVRGVLSGSVLTFNAQDRYPHDWLVRAWNWHQPGEDANALALAVAGCLWDPEPRVRSGAIQFFQFAQDAPDGGELSRALLHAQGAFHEAADPLGLATLDLRAELARAVTAEAKRIPSVETLESLRRECFRPGAAVAVVAGLLAVDGAWLLDHAGELIELSPPILRILLLNVTLARRDPGPLVQAATARLGGPAVLAAIDEAFPARPDIRVGLRALVSP
jgi:hypothetical protein